MNLKDLRGVGSRKARHVTSRHVPVNTTSSGKGYDERTPRAYHGGPSGDCGGDVRKGGVCGSKGTACRYRRHRGEHGDCSLGD
jgi:hypothetical protein